VNNDGGTLFIFVVRFEDKYTDELRVLSISRERAVDVTEFILVPVSIDD
jgi:hypothetical protein